MMKYYTHYSTFKNQIFVRYIDENGNRRNGFYDFAPKYFTETDTVLSETKTIFGKNVIEKTSDSCKTLWKDTQKYKDVHGLKIHGSSNAALQYVAQKFPENLIDIANSEEIRRINLDIETESEVSIGFPDLIDPMEKVNAITAYDSIHKKFIVLYCTEIDFTAPKFAGLDLVPIYCEDEETLLRKFVDFWKYDYPDVVSGWNIDGFDIPYLLNRIEKILGKSTAESLSPVGFISRRTGKNDKGQQTFDYKIRGVEIVDTLTLYKKIELSPRESYTLEFISTFELDVGKLHHPSAIPGHLLYKEQKLHQLNIDDHWGEWEYHRLMIEEYLAGGSQDTALFAKIQKEFNEAFILYNILDVKRCFEIEEKKNLFKIAYFLAYYSYSNFSEVTASMKFWSNLLFVYCYNELNLVFPMFKEKTFKDGTFTGAYVRPTQAGVYKGPGSVVTYDIVSMYPSLIRVLNISPETLCNKKYDIDVTRMLSGDIPDINPRHSLGVNGAAFDNTKMGVLPRKVEELFNKRKHEKGIAGKIFTEIEEINAEIAKREELQ